MNIPRAFEDDRLNADLAAILRLRDRADPPLIDHPPHRARNTLTSALRSPRASATIGVSFFIAMLGTTAFLMYHSPRKQLVDAVPVPSTPQLRADKAPASHPASAATIGDAKSATVLAAGSRIIQGAGGASQDSRHVRSALRSRSKVQSRRSYPATAVADSEGKFSTPVLLESQGKLEARPATDLAQNFTTLPLQHVKVYVDQTSDASPTSPDASGEDQSAQARRNSVAAIRALRRQW